MRSHPRAPLSIALVGLALFAVSTGALTATAATVEPDAPVVVETAGPDAPVVVETAEPDAALIESAAETDGPSISATQAPLDAPMIITPVNPTFVVASGFPVSVATEISLGQINVEDRQFVTMLLEGEDVDPVVCLSVGLDHTILEYSCSFDVPGPGRYELRALSVETLDPEYEAVSEPVTLIVGSDAPPFLGFPESDTVTPQLSGTGPALGSVEVTIFYGGEASVPYCTVSEVPASGTWSCSPTSAPQWSWGRVAFRAEALDVAETPIPDFDEIALELVPPPPQTTFGLGPASVAVTAQGASDTFLQTRVYETDFANEETPFTEFDTCNAVGNPPVVQCTLAGLSPGVWNFYTVQDFGEMYFDYYVDEYVLIPATPTGFSATVGADRSVRFAGTGQPGFRAIVRNAAGSDLCSVIVGAGGAWQCTASPPVGTSAYRAIQQSVGFTATPPGNFAPVGVGVNEFDSFTSFDGFSSFTAPLSVTVPPAPSAAASPPAPTPSPTPTVPSPGSVEITALPAVAPAGSEIDVQGNTDCIEPVVCDVDVDIFSTPQRLGSTVTNSSGAFALRVVVPESLEPGGHTIVVTVTPRGGTPTSVSQPITIDPATAEPAPVGQNSAGSEQGGPAGAGAEGGVSDGTGDRSNPAAPSAISDSIPTIERIFSAPLTILVSGGLALLILILVAFPAELLNSTIASNTRRLGRWYAAVESGVDRATDWFASVTRTRALAAAVLVVLTSLIFGFVDPNYGFDPVSVRMTISLAIGLFIVTYVSSWISGAIIRRVWNIETRVGLQPAALVFAVIGVIVARVLEFSPGFLIGLVIGLDIVTRVGASHRVRAILTNIGVIVGLAVLAWAGFSIMTAVMTGEPTFGSLLVSDALVAATAEGLTAALAALLPLGFLDGHEVFRRSKLLWAGSFAFVATVFSLIVLPTAAGETDDVADVGFWILIMVIFAAVTLTLWALLHFTGGSDSDDDELAEEPAVAAR